jgi:hypothetical protein
MTNESFDPPLDAGIAPFVELLRRGDVETFESCEGGRGHAFPVPTVRFHGDEVEGYRAFAIARGGGLQPTELRRAWRVAGAELVGPWWEMTFARRRRRAWMAQ